MIPLSRFVLVLSVLISAVAAPLAAQDGGRPRVIVLGFDGVDHGLASEFMAAGHLPNLQKLAASGSFSALETTNPSESAVSWATFGRGMNPGKTNMFGFVARRPGGYLPEVRFMNVKDVPWTEVYDGAPGGGGMVWMIGLGIAGLVLGLVLGRALGLGGAAAVLALLLAGGGAVLGRGMGGGVEAPPESVTVPTLEQMVQGKALWEHLDDAGVRVKGFLVPMAAPIPDLQAGKMTGGLGVPDLRDGQIGSYFLYSSSRKDVPSGKTRTTGSSALVLRLEQKDDTWVAPFRGPVDRRRRAEVEARLAELDKDKLTMEERREKRALQKEKKKGFDRELELSITRAGEGALNITVGDAVATVKEGDWSDWMVLDFGLAWPLNARGLTRCRVLSAGEDIRVFFAPLGYHPEDLPPHLQAEDPSGFSGRIAAESGLYDTLGWPCLTNSLKDTEIDEGVFLEHIKKLTAERSGVLFNELAKDDWDFYFTMFGEPDRVQHMMFRNIDPEHPTYDAKVAETYATCVLDTYKAMDEIVGRVVDEFLDGRTHLFVVSDHGFTSFRRQVSLNSWLIQEGFLVPKRGGRDTEDLARRYPGRRSELLLWYMDEKRSRAFALGLGKIYINLKGREADGIVEPDDYDAVCDEIAAGLLELRDPENGQKVVRRVWRRDELYQGPFVGTDADLIVGFEEYYRVSWATTMGGFSAKVIEDNTQRWSGGHASNDPDVVPGIFFSDLGLQDGQSPGVLDMAPTIMALFGVRTEGLDGEVLRFR